MTHTFSPWARCWHTWWLYKNNQFDNWYLTNLYLCFFPTPSLWDMGSLNMFPLARGRSAGKANQDKGPYSPATWQDLFFCVSPGGRLGAWPNSGLLLIDPQP